MKLLQTTNPAAPDFYDNRKTRHYCSAYHCADCGETWETVWVATLREECPQCGAITQPLETVEIRN